MKDELNCPMCGASIGEFKDSGFYECDKCPFMCALPDFHRLVRAMSPQKDTEIMSLVNRNAAIIGAIKWERECFEVFSYFLGKYPYPWMYIPKNELSAFKESEDTYNLARNAVDKEVG